jgi:mono/diheme cytochrome c family protein
MVRSYYGIIALSILTMMGPTSPKKGCQGAVKALTTLAYPEKRDMRTSVALLSQRGWYREPDSASVPIEGRDVLGDVPTFDATFTLPTASSPEAIQRGATKYAKTCVPCHGPKLDGQGPVWTSKKFLVPIPNLLQPQTVARSDGYIYRYIRFGGAIMPSYGAQVTADEAYDLIHFVRDKQKQGTP